MSGQRKSIVLASVLKPVDDTRMFEKFALTLSQSNKYEINIIGFRSKKYPSQANIRLYPIFKFDRLSLYRLFAPIKYYQKLRKIRPSTIIVHTHELLLASTLYCFFNSCDLYYDILENYALNIAHNRGYSRWIRTLLSSYVRLKEVLLAPAVKHFFLAESVYERDLGFTSKKSTLLLNKFVKMDVPETRRIPWQIIYSGTIEKRYGIFEAIELCIGLHTLQPNIRLVIIGYAAHAPTLEKVKELIREHSFIELMGGDQPVPHQDILKKIAESSYALVPHRLDPSIRDNFPSKIYEYMAFQVPMIMRKHPAWNEVAAKYSAAIFTDFNEKPSEILLKIRSVEFYPDGVGQEIFWEEEGRKLLEVLDR